MKKLVTVMLALVLVVSSIAFAGCNQKIGREEISGGDGSGGSLEIICMKAGFGTDWLKKIATEFSKKYNVNVGVTNGSNNGEMNSNVENKQSEYDIVMTTGAQFRLADAKAVHDLREIYNYKPDGGDKTVAQKMNQKIYDMLLQEDGSIYFMNWANSLQGLFYNMTTLREVYGEDFSESQLPKTTGELIDMAKDISSKEDYVAFSASTGITYWDYCVDAWGAQYTGSEEYYNYYQASYTDAEGNLQFAETYGELQSSVSPGRLSAMKIMEEILKPSNGLVHENANSMDYIQMQKAFAGNGYRGNMTKCAFIADGDWMANELALDLAKNPQDIGIMKLPVNSYIIETLNDKSITDEELAQIVGFVDDGFTYEEVKTKEGFSDLTSDDYERIADARTYSTVATLNHSLCVPITTKNKDNAFNFLKYMLTEEAQKIYSDTLGGRAMVYGYEPDMTNASYFEKSIANIGNYTPIVTDYSSPYVYNGGLRYCGISDRYVQLMNGKSAQDIEEQINTHWSENWKSIIAAKPVG